MNWCQSCGERYSGATHSCGHVTISKDRLRELEAAEAVAERANADRDLGPMSEDCRT